jgi:hypothetical protein
MRRREADRRCGVLRAWFASRHSGGAGAPPGITKGPRQELADDPRAYPNRWSSIERRKAGHLG